ncbi:MAG: hypothetical protein K0A93_07820 [Desulfuromonadaceae bacterium]|nr:hypothetical protein [Desulfuromonadaceae bacterium]
MTIFIGGTQKRVKRPPTVEGMDADEFICRNADPLWLHQNEMWEVLYERDMDEETETPETFKESSPDDIPF